MTPIRLEFPCRLYSLTNMRTHWSKKAKIAKEQRMVVWSEWNRSKRAIPTLPLTVKLTRIAPKELDGDNLQSSFKSIRDAVAKELGINDGDKRITWLYAQERGKPKESRVRIEIT